MKEGEIAVICGIPYCDVKQNNETQQDESRSPSFLSVLIYVR